MLNTRLRSNAVALARITLEEPGSKQWPVVAPEFLWKRPEALSRLSATTICSASTRPAISFLIIDQVVDGELRA